VFKPKAVTGNANFNDIKYTIKEYLVNKDKANNNNANLKNDNNKTVKSPNNNMSPRNLIYNAQAV